GLAGATGGAAGARKMQGLLDTTKPVASEAEAGLVIRAMVMAAKADGEIDANEREALFEVLDETDPSDRAFLEQAMAAPVDVEALARDVPGGMEVEIYAAALMAIDPDNRAEAEFLDRLAQRLNVSRAHVNDIHEAQGKPPLYTL
uniref:tellurite resistance TerB family protein n=1 Tax=Oceaniglobus roseus TaxID=1737570 RepID=UPI000C7EA6A7